MTHSAHASLHSCTLTLAPNLAPLLPHGCDGLPRLNARKVATDFQYSATRVHRQPAEIQTFRPCLEHLKACTRGIGGSSHASNGILDAGAWQSQCVSTTNSYPQDAARVWPSKSCSRKASVETKARGMRIVTIRSQRGTLDEPRRDRLADIFARRDETRRFTVGPHDRTSYSTLPVQGRFPSNRLNPRNAARAGNVCNTTRMLAVMHDP